MKFDFDSFKLCIDPGHGLSNKKSGVYDTGAIGGIYEEAALALVWGHALRHACEELGLPVFMTREHRDDVTPLGSRVKRAEQEGCTHFISLHFNDAEVKSANGFETLYRTPHSLTFAQGLNAQLKPLPLRNRGVILRTDLAVLVSSKMPSALIELGFIGNMGDMNVLTNDSVMQRTCNRLAVYLKMVAKGTH